MSSSRNEKSFQIVESKWWLCSSRDFAGHWIVVVMAPIMAFRARDVQSPALRSRRDCNGDFGIAPEHGPEKDALVGTTVSTSDDPSLLTNAPGFTVRSHVAASQGEFQLV